MTSDWVMVIITGVYVAATICICRANFKSAKASEEQLKELQRQYAEVNRPIIEVEFHYIRKAAYCVQFVNRGTKTAQHVKINVDPCFIASLPEETFQKELERLRGKECIIGVGQHYDLFIGTNKLRGNPNMMPFTGTVEYESQGNRYQSDIFVDLEHYSTFFSMDSHDEDLSVSVKKISEEIKNIRRLLYEQAEEKTD